ncbi:MAG: AMMECR1 family protein, partial [Candidatus Obscuribacterales bacterium]|nr:AMMECR1 family protein [Candidatus Obscuribacterales bacterium]
PVKADELGDIEIEISVLTPPRRIESIDQIELGRHGIVLYIEDCQSVFLPHVATEFGWSLEETLDQLCIKAGQPPGAWRKDAKFDIFETLMFE